MPITPDQIAQNALDAANAGAAIVHIHARNPETGQPSADLELYREIVGKIRAKNQEIIICLTTGGGAGMTVEIGSTPNDIMNLHTTAERLFGTGKYNWSVIGAGKAEFPATTMALILGGHVRVGMEDNLYLGKGVLAKNNGELVAKMVRIMTELDLQPATPVEAREILALSK